MDFVANSNLFKRAPDAREPVVKELVSAKIKSTTSVGDKKSTGAIDHSNTVMETSVQCSTGKTESSTTFRASRPQTLDVLLGRGRPFQTYPGNRRMLSIVSKEKEQYASIPKGDRRSFVEFVLERILKGGTRFLRRVTEDDDSSERWEEVSRSVAMAKVSHALRSRYQLKTSGRSERTRSEQTRESAQNLASDENENCSGQEETKGSSYDEFFRLCRGVGTNYNGASLSELLDGGVRYPAAGLSSASGRRSILDHLGLLSSSAQVVPLTLHSLKFPYTVDALKFPYTLGTLERYPFVSSLLPSIPDMLSAQILSDYGSVPQGNEVVSAQTRALLGSFALNGSLAPNGLYFSR